MSKPSDSHGEHPYGDAGQLILLGIFLIVWAGDSFFLHLSTSLKDYLPVSIRLILLVLCLAVAAFLVKSSHGVVSHSDPRLRPYFQRSLQVCEAPSLSRVHLVLPRPGAFHGFPLFSGSLGCHLLFYNYLASYEEKLLEAEFGESYIIYKKQTGKWLPRMPFFH